MGVCIGTCSKVDKNTAEIKPGEKNDIKNNLQPGQFEGDDCNVNTADN